MSAIGHEAGGLGNVHGVGIVVDCPGCDGKPYVPKQAAWDGPETTPCGVCGGKGTWNANVSLYDLWKLLNEAKFIDHTYRPPLP